MAVAYVELLLPVGPQRYPLTDHPLTIGRHAKNRIPLNEALASRRHCVVEATAQGYRLRDLGSTNGTRVNDKPMAEAMLHDGDVIRIGKTELRYHGPEPDESAPPSKPAKRTKEDPATLLAGTSFDQPGTPPAKAEPPRPGAFHEDSDSALLIVDSPPPKPGPSDTYFADDTSEATRAGMGPGADCLRQVLALCVHANATGIRIELKGDDYVVYFRINGRMIPVGIFDRQSLDGLIGTVKDIKSITRKG